MTACWAWNSARSASPTLRKLLMLCSNLAKAKHSSNRAEAASIKIGFVIEGVLGVHSNTLLQGTTFRPAILKERGYLIKKLKLINFIFTKAQASIMIV